MNDEELEQRLHAEIQELVRPPYGAPDTLRRRVGSLDMLEPIRYGSGRGLPSIFRKPRNLAAAAVVALLVGSAMFFRPSTPYPGNSVQLPASFEMFGRVDSNTAWVEDGADLYITRDDGGSWTKGTVPGGSSLKTYELQQGMGGQMIGGLATAEPSPTDNGGVGYDHLYPVFVDADHGWLLSWKVSNAISNANGCEVGDWTLTLWRTSDGARSWQSSVLPGIYKGYGTVQFTDTQHGWVTVERLDSAMCSRKTASSGGSVGSVPAPGSELPDATPAATATAVPLPEDATTVLASSDGGASWTRASTLNELAMIHFDSTDEAWGYGVSNAGSMDSVLHSTDGSRTWTRAQLPLPAGAGIAGIGQAPEEDGGIFSLRVVAYQSQPSLSQGFHPAASDNSGISYSGPSFEILTFASNDGGQTWKLDATRAIPGDSPNLMTGYYFGIIQAPSGQPIAAIQPSYAGGGSDGSTFSSTPDSFQASFDGGVSWLSYPTKGLPSSVGMAQWTSQDDVWVMSTGGGAMVTRYGVSTYIYSTRDGGKTWTGIGGAPAWPASPQPTIPPQVVGPDVTYPVTETPQPMIAPQAMIGSMGRVDANVGWVEISGLGGGNELRMTSDGGATWSEPRVLPDWGEIQFVDANRGFLVSSSAGPGVFQSLTVFSTSDGGRSWQSSVANLGATPDDLIGPSGGSTGSASLHFRDANHGELYSAMAYGQGADVSDMTKWKTVCRQASTADGGVTWTTPREGPCMSEPTFLGTSFGFGQDLAGSAGVYLTSDGGQTWVNGTLPVAKDAPGGAMALTTLLLVDRRSDGSLCALSSSYGAMNLDVSTDGGKTWAPSPLGGGLTDVNGRGNSDTFVRLGEGHWLELSSINAFAPSSPAETVDGGQTWTPVAGTGLEVVVGKASFVTPTDGWVTGGTFDCPAAANGSTQCQQSSDLLATSDGGQTWRTILTP